MASEHYRQALVSALPQHIRSQVPQSPVPRLHVIAIVQTCERFTDGATALVRALRLTLGRTPESEDVIAIIERHWGGPTGS